MTDSSSAASSSAAVQVASPADFKVWACVLCGFIYNEAEGLPDMDIAPGTRWADVPDSFVCPDCSATKADFEMIEI